MKTVNDVSEALSKRTSTTQYRKTKLADDAGVNYRTLQHVLTGSQDFKVSTLLAVADRLGLELMLVPKEATSMFPEQKPPPAVPTKVQAALERLRARRS